MSAPQLAFDVIERNAQQMTDISDALFYRRAGDEN